MVSRPIAALAVGVIAATAAACTSSTSGSGAASKTQSHSPKTSVSAPSSSSTTTSSGTPITPAALAHNLTAALAKVSSAHITLAGDTGGQRITGTGVERLHGGKVTAMHLTESFGQGVGKLEIVLLNGKGWIKVPTQASKTSKPWLSLTARSSNPIVKSLAKMLNSTLATTSVSATALFVRAASSVRVDLGAAMLNGTPATHVHLVVDTAKLASTLPGAPGLSAVGIKTLPVNLYVDRHWRPLLSSLSLTVAGERVATKVAVSKYNQPVTITAPPASQIAN